MTKQTHAPSAHPAHSQPAMAIDLAGLQAEMRAQGIGLWIVYDFRGSSGVFDRLLPPHPASAKRWTTRRVYLAIPSAGEPELLVHAIDASQFDHLSVKKTVYLAWPELHAWLSAHIAQHGPRVGMEYSPGNALPVVSSTDAGTVDLVRALGGEVVSSANLIQASIARWSAQAALSHEKASIEVARIKDEAFALIRERLKTNAPVSERDVQALIQTRFADAGLEFTSGPVVAANEHSADPHFEVAEHGSSPIRAGDWVLIDLWARLPGDHNIYSDITWVAYAGTRSEIPSAHAKVFDAVRQARDASAALAQHAHAKGERLPQGWQLDDAAREVLIARGHREHIRHRTGHSLSAGPQVHGLGVNLDNLETHDTREIIPGVGWTIEPGAYIPGPGGFGVRLEINMHHCPKRGPIITSCVQDQIVCLA